VLIKFDFPKTARLLNAGQYSNLFAKVDIKVANRNFLILASDQERTEARIGIILAKKKIRLATQRNRIKRIIRESFRLRSAGLPDLDIVVMAHKGADKQDNQTLSEDLERLWKKLNNRYSGMSVEKNRKRPADK